MKSILFSAIFMIQITCFSQTPEAKKTGPSHGLAAGFHYNSIEKSSVSLGYHFVHSIGHDINRFVHRYTADYLLNLKIWGASADVGYIWGVYKFGVQGGFRNGTTSKDQDIKDWYISPQFGFDFFVGDLTVGPSFHHDDSYGRNVSFKLSAHFNYPIWGGEKKKLREKAVVF
jgi:hypothetical protein